MSFTQILTRLCRNEQGLAAVEYALLLGLIVLVMIASLGNLSNAISDTWNHVNSETQTAVQHATGG